MHEVCRAQTSEQVRPRSSPKCFNLNVFLAKIFIFARNFTLLQGILLLSYKHLFYQNANNGFYRLLYDAFVKDVLFYWY